MKIIDNIELSVIPRDMTKISQITGNLYESVVVISKRAHQLAVLEKHEITEKLAEFAPRTDSLEEVYDNREQMEIATHYEKMPKPSVIAINEFINGKIYFRKPEITEEQETENDF